MTQRRSQRAAGVLAPIMGQRRGWVCGAGVVMAGLLGLVVIGCVAPAPELNGGELYHHNWWNYYARGAFFLKENRTREAADDFRRSLGLQPGARFGNSRDMWRARTYGLHFVEGYFPNRELGVCLYESGDYTQAVHHLEASLRQEPSGRAKHYLNLAYEKLMAGRAVAAPTVRVEQTGGVAYTGSRSYTVSGTASGEGRIRRLAVCGQDEFVELAGLSLPFRKKVALSAGTNVLEVVAEDLKGQRVRQEVVRVADWQPPRFTVRRAFMRDGAWQIEGVCCDTFGVVSVASDGRTLFKGSDGNAPAEVPVTLSVSAEGSTLVAEDIAGNRLECPLSPASLALAALRADVPGASGMKRTVLAQMEAWSAVCRGPGGAVAPRLLAQTAFASAGDRLRPSLSLRGCPPVTRVFSEDFFVDGTAADGGGLASVTINGENLLSASDAGAARSYFARRLPLDVGTNTFEVAATDCSGNRTAQALTVVRAQPEYLDDRYRLSVGVPPLTPAETGAVATRVKRALESELMRAPVRFRLLERDEGWDFVLREQGLSVSDLADPSAALRIGKMVPAEMLLMGRIFAEAKGVTVYLKAVETGNGEVVFASDVYSPDPEAGLDEVVAGLVLKVEQGFPLVTGEVLKCQGSRVTLSVGLQDGAVENSRFLVFGGEPDRGAGGLLCKAEGEPVQLHVDRVQQNTSTARVIPSAADALVKEGYHVYTR